MSNNFLSLLDNYPIETIIAILSFLANILFFINKRLPIHFQLNKKYYFFRNVKNTICSINICIKCNKKVKSSEIKNKLLELSNFRLINDENGLFIFESLNTNLTYKLKIGENYNQEEYTLIIELSNAFKTTRLGNIRRINSSLEELQKIINTFSIYKKDIESINSQIKIFPQNKLMDKEESLEIKIQDKNYFLSCSKEMISVKNKGIPNSKKLIQKGLNLWMKYFI